MFKARRTMAGAAAAILTLTLGACSSGEGSDSSGTSSSRLAFTPKDVTDPGDDLLGRVRLSRVFSGALLEASWKFPTSFEPISVIRDNGKAYTADKQARISIQAGSGDQSAAAAALTSAQRQAEAKGQKTSLDTVKVKGREFAVLVQDTPEAAILTYSHAPDGDDKFYIVQLAATTSLADVPQERLDGFLQTVGSLQFERPGPRPGL